MGLIRMWRRLRHREQSATAEARRSQSELERTRREVTQLRHSARENRFAELLREGIAAGYRLQEGGPR